MLKWNRDKMKGFAMGAITVTLLGSLVGTAFASGKLTTINVVQGGIKLFVDGKMVIPTDDSGKVVEPFIYDGTTYLPLRALSNALTNNQKSVKWESDKSSIYIGQVPTAAQTDITDIEPYERQGTVLKAGDTDLVFNLLDKKIAPFNRLASGYRQYAGMTPPNFWDSGHAVYSYTGSGAYYTYLLNSKYSQLDALFAVPYTEIGAKGEATVQFYNVNKKGEETLIKEVSAKTTDEILPVSVNLAGVEILKLKFDGSESAFYNVILTGLQ